MHKLKYQRNIHKYIKYYNENFHGDGLLRNHAKKYLYFRKR